MGCAASKLSGRSEPAVPLGKAESAPQGGKVFNLDANASSRRLDTIAACPSPRGSEGEQWSAPKQHTVISSSSRAGGARARRLSLPGSILAAAAGPKLSGTASSVPEAQPAASSSSTGDVPSQPPVALSAQPALPVAHPLPQRHVHFDDSPVKTHKLPQEEAEEEAAAATTPHTQPRTIPRFAQPPPPRPPPQQAAAQQPRSTSPSKAVFDAALAARATTGAVAAPLAASGSPSKAAAAAVPMSHLIHSVASLSRAGREPAYRKTNQDNCFAYQHYCRPNQALLAALDGHGPHGHAVSGFLKRHMPVALAEQLGEAPTPTSLDASFSSTAASASRTPRGASSSGSGNASSNGSSGGAAAAADTAAALSTTFLQLDARLAVEPGLSVQYSGSTAVVCMLQGRRLTTAWVGDSKAVLARQDPRGVRAIPLTRDHKPNHPDERTRITAAGGRVERLMDGHGTPVGPQRVWLPTSWVPGLAMSRAIGDAVAHSVGVSSEPETSVVEVSLQDRWLILATDGVWEFIDPQGAVDIVSGCKDAEEACRTLVDAAWGKWLVEEEGVVDDITVVAVRFNP